MDYCLDRFIIFVLRILGENNVEGANERKVRWRRGEERRIDVTQKLLRRHMPSSGQ